MIATIKQWKNQFLVIAAVLFLLLVIAGTGSTVQAEEGDIPASTFLPFANQQALNLDGTNVDRWVYPTDSNYIYISYQHDTITDERDIKVQKLDKDGKSQWIKVYNFAGQDTVQLVHMQKNGFIMAITNNKDKKNTVRILQIASNGEIAWQRDLPLQQVNTIASTNDSGLIVVGVDGVDDKDIHIIKLDEDGEWQKEPNKVGKWEKVYKLEGNQQVSQITQVLDKEDYNDGYVLTGYTDHNTNGQQDLYIMRLNAYGDVKWSKNYGGSGNDQGTSLAIIVDEDDDVMGFLATGYTTNNRGDKNIYQIYVDKYGWLQSWPGYQTMVDKVKERQFGGEFDQTGMALVPVPKGFLEKRKLRGEVIPGEGGGLLVGYYPKDKSVLAVRISMQGEVLWQKKLPIPGDELIMGTIEKGDDFKQEIAYCVSYPDAAGKKMEFYALKLFLEGVLEEDKTIPKEDQLETNGEAIQWEKRTLTFEAMRDISKEIKDLMKLQLPVPLTATSTIRGEIDWPDTSYYLGNLVIGKADGSGTLLFPDGVWYKGAWINNMFNGKGYLRFPTGENYEGDFKDHMMTGQGIFKWPTGECYSGPFLNNMREGKGVFTWPGGIVYEGDFIKDNAEGQGIIRWPSGERYEGEMQKGNANGQGSYYFPSGEWYRGEVKSLKFEGVGVYHWPNGAYYVGEFKGDRLHGEGYYVWPNGVQQWGYWKNDRYVGINKEALDSKGKW